jgi:hypothetical protein
MDISINPKISNFQLKRKMGFYHVQYLGKIAINSSHIYIKSQHHNLYYFDYTSLFLFVHFISLKTINFVVNMQSDSTQRLPLLSQAEGEDMDFHSDSDEPLQFFDTEKFTVREKLLGFASIMLLTGLLVFAYLYQQVGGGHHHGGMNMAALDKVNIISKRKWSPHCVTHALNGKSPQR